MENFRWISVSERLPDEDEDDKASDWVLVTVKDNNKDNIFVCDDITVSGMWANFKEPDYSVIAWKPLPDPCNEVIK